MYTDGYGYCYSTHAKHKRKCLTWDYLGWDYSNNVLKNSIYKISTSDNPNISTIHGANELSNINK